MSNSWNFSEQYTEFYSKKCKYNKHLVTMTLIFNLRTAFWNCYSFNNCYFDNKRIFENAISIIFSSLICHSKVHFSGTFLSRKQILCFKFLYLLKHFTRFFSLEVTYSFVFWMKSSSKTRKRSIGNLLKQLCVFVFKCVAKQKQYRSLKNFLYTDFFLWFKLLCNFLVY